jgi:hypothetical protein
VSVEDVKDVSFKAQVADGSRALRGYIVMEPFKAGENVAATPEVEQASLMMVKGFVESVSQAKSRLKVIIGEDISKAKFLVRGYIVAFDRPEGLIDYVQKKPNVVAVEGKVVSLEDSRVVVDFSSSVQSVEEKDFNGFAYKLGQRLASYLTGQDKKAQ